MSFRSWIGTFWGGSAYDGANESTNRRTYAGTKSRATDEERNVSAWGRDRLRLECRNLFRNDPVVHGAVNRVADFVVGPDGILPQAKTSDKTWNSLAESYFWERGKIMDARGRLDMRQMQRLDTIALFVDGESFGVMTNGGQIQPVEAERVQTPADLSGKPNVLDGMRLSDTGRVLGAYVLARGDYGAPDSQDFEFVDSVDLIHFSDPFRVDQVRGIPMLAAMLNTAKDLADLQGAVLTKARMDARNAWAIFSREGAAKAQQLGPRRATSENASAGQVQEFERFDEPRNYYLKTDDKIQSLASATPNPQHVEFCKHYMRAMGSAFGLPYELLSLDFSGGSFSSDRAKLMIAYRRIAAFQAMHARKWQRIWNWTIARGIKDGDLPPAPLNELGFSDWYNVQWINPRADWIDPEAQVNAEKSAIGLGVESLSSVSLRYGKDAEATLREKAGDIKLAREIAAEIGVDWRDLFDVSMNPQRAATVQPVKKDDEPQPEGLARWLT